MCLLTNSIGHVEKVFETTNRRDIYNEALTKVLSTQIEVYKNGFESGNGPRNIYRNVCATHSLYLREVGVVVDWQAFTA